VLAAPDEELGRKEDDGRKEREQEAERVRGVEVGARDGVEDFERECVGALRDVAAEHHRDAHLARDAGAGEKERRRETRPHERERDPEEDVAPARAVDAGGLLEFDEARRGERRLKRTHDER